MRSAHFLGFLTMTPVVKLDFKILPTMKRMRRNTGISTMRSRTCGSDSARNTIAPTITPTTPQKILLFRRIWPSVRGDGVEAVIV